MERRNPRARLDLADLVFPELSALQPSQQNAARTDYQFRTMEHENVRIRAFRVDCGLSGVSNLDDVTQARTKVHNQQP
jgi:hypothetical protein